MTNIERRVELLETAAGPTMTDAEAEALALQQMPDDELDRQVREILANKDPPAEDDHSEDAELYRKAVKGIANMDRRRAWEKEQWGHLPLMGKGQP